MAQRQAVAKKQAPTYKRSLRAVKTRILDQLVELTGWHRDYARAALRHALNPPPRPRTGRRPLYGPDLLPPLVLCWSVLRAPAALLVRMSASTIDRKLKGARPAMLPHGRTHTKPGSLLKFQIPMRTWAE